MQTQNRFGINDRELFKDYQDYWQVAKNIQKIYTSSASIAVLLDFERVLDELDLYAFKNWIVGELVDGPEISRYKVAATFMWPERMMPDPRGAMRLTPFDCAVYFQRKTIKIPMKITDPSDYRPGTHKARLIDQNVWLVTIVMPKHLINDIKTGSQELQDETIDLEDLDNENLKELSSADQAVSTVQQNAADQMSQIQ